MKRFLAFGLIMLLFAAIQFAVPTKAGPIDQDVGICYVAQMDQELVNVMDNHILTVLDCGSYELAVEKEDALTYIINPIEIQSMDYEVAMMTDNPMNQMTNLQGVNSKNRDLGGLDTGSLFSQVGATTRHV